MLPRETEDVREPHLKKKRTKYMSTYTHTQFCLRKNKKPQKTDAGIKFMKRSDSPRQTSDEGWVGWGKAEVPEHWTGTRLTNE